MAVGNQFDELAQAGEDEKKKIFEGVTKRSKPNSYINYELDNEDIQGAEERNDGSILVARSIDKARNQDYKPKKKLRNK